MSGLDPVRRVLIVDNERPVAESLALILLRNGYASRVVYSGEAAVDLARVFEPDLLITDVALTGMTGIEAATEILSFLPGCRVILFSGEATTLELLRDCHRSTLKFELLAKPVSAETLQDRIAKLG